MNKVVIVGGGIAGVAAAAFISETCEVVLLEMERTLAYHTTGRSAALFVINYGGQGTRPLARASRGFFESPPEGSTEFPLLSKRGTLWIADERQRPHLLEIYEEGTASGAGSELIESTAALEMAPVLRPEVVSAALWEPSGMDIDVAGLHQAYVRIARRNGTNIRTNSAVRSITPRGSSWEVTTDEGTEACDAVVNAAGAWGDVVAGLAGVEPIGLVPMRRTAFMVPGSPAYSNMPLVIDADHTYYFKPDGTQLLCSLAEETPDVPRDAKPEMEDVALAIERINEATTLDIRTVNSQWAGLRTFAPDRDLVVGEDPTAPGFFWLVGQGGMGIATSPAYGALIGALVTGREIPDHLLESGVDPSATDPARLRP